MVPTFLYSLAGGMMAVLATGRMDQIAWRFLRTVTAISFALLCGLTAWQFTQRGPADITTAWTLWLGIGAGMWAAGTIFLAPAVLRLATPFRAMCAIGGLLGLAAGCVSGVELLYDEGLTTPATVMIVLSELLGGLMIGSITVAWLLGHAYLTATKMTIAPLRHFSRILSLAVAVRIGFLLVSLGVAWLQGGGETTVIQSLWQAWLVVTLRVAVGLLAVGLFAYMVADCVRLRSTQSATGILYFGSVFAYIGELASQQLIIECGWPL